MAGRHGDGESTSLNHLCPKKKSPENRDFRVTWAPFSHLHPHHGDSVVPSLTGPGSGFLLFLAKYTPSTACSWVRNHKGWMRLSMCTYSPNTLLRSCNVGGPQGHVVNGRELWSCPLGFSTWPALAKRCRSWCLWYTHLGALPWAVLSKANPWFVYSASRTCHKCNEPQISFS